VSVNDFFETSKSICRFLNCLFGDRSFREHVLPETHRLANVFDNIEMTVPVHRPDDETNGVGPDINGG
jgi:hypothetical protein